MKKITKIIKSNSSIFKNFSFLAVLQIFNLVLPLLTYPYLISILGAEYFGLISFSIATITYFNVVVDYGFNLTATREISINRDNLDKLTEIFSSVISIKIILMTICFLILLILILFFELFNSNTSIYLCTFGIVVGQVLFPVWFFQGMEKMKYITYLNVISKTIFTIAIFVFINEKEDILLVPIFNSSGAILSGILSFFILKKYFKIKFKFQSFLTLKKYLVDGWNIFIIDFLPNLYNNFSVFFLGIFAPLEIVGFYALAMKLVGVLNSFIYVIRNVTYPYLIKDQTKINVISKIIITVGLIFSVCVFIFSKLIVPLVFGKTGEESLIFLYILGLSPLFLSITISYGANRLLVMKKDKIMRNITIQYSLIGFVLALILIPIYGAYGAAFTVVITRLIMSVLTYKKGVKI
ncbi:oligosaccharide flippase family protein [Tenacibaculum dicentrarchi]|uniref:Polysaccharide biosynthesis protein n=1 Tax=Tenacibaculum dicentrarchi TaxID=669041 RepID=A0ABP1EF99_9FLAO|nr:oligosaccharide flippase family protein [Tenacibaculum dicentrarchi]MCD8408187.1 oligosaccharide flippase family protein [Tenacibaculum dicentrarchi]MCD8415804.1 oligosaccharide flippase family protein [Tenacibaculum dicentrarchi]MCD8420928.1 oligosaccharide flippase family protein [Tenacibaculum dicentrarchi]MCD8425792.1 oligosaccharide flippase family protein [Tenacibaculum dicentrarchi]